MQPVEVGSVGVGVGPRAIAVIIDGIILGVIGVILARVAGTVGTAIVAVAAVCYFPVMEKVWGATIGKMALGLKVVMEDGSPISWGAAIIRFILRIIDGLFVYLVGAIFVWTSPRRQRLGDRAAHTLVVKKDAAVSAAPAGQF